MKNEMVSYSAMISSLPLSSSGTTAELSGSSPSSSFIAVFILPYSFSHRKMLTLDQLNYCLLNWDYKKKRTTRE